jgi:hypothetical protein
MKLYINYLNNFLLIMAFNEIGIIIIVNILNFTTFGALFTFIELVPTIYLVSAFTLLGIINLKLSYSGTNYLAMMLSPLCIYFDSKPLSLIMGYCIINQKYIKIKEVNLFSILILKTICDVLSYFNLDFPLPYFLIYFLAIIYSKGKSWNRYIIIFILFLINYLVNTDNKLSLALNLLIDLIFIIYYIRRLYIKNTLLRSIKRCIILINISITSIDYTIYNIKVRDLSAALYLLCSWNLGTNFNYIKKVVPCFILFTTLIAINQHYNIGALSILINIFSSCINSTSFFTIKSHKLPNLFFHVNQLLIIIVSKFWVPTNLYGWNLSFYHFYFIIYFYSKSYFTIFKRLYYENKWKGIIYLIAKLFLLGGLSVIKMNFCNNYWSIVDIYMIVIISLDLIIEWYICLEPDRKRSKHNNKINLRLINECVLNHKDLRELRLTAYNLCSCPQVV